MTRASASRLARKYPPKAPYTEEQIIAGHADFLLDIPEIDIDNPQMMQAMVNVACQAFVKLGVPPDLVLNGVAEVLGIMKREADTQAAAVAAKASS